METAFIIILICFTNIIKPEPRINYIPNHVYRLSNSYLAPNIKLSNLDKSPFPTLLKQYVEFTNVFLEDNTRKVLAYSNMDYINHLINGDKPFFRHIHSLSKCILINLWEDLE